MREKVDKYDERDVRDCHRNDFSLEIADGGGPVALVDDELAEPVISCVLVRFGYDPGWRVRYSQIVYLSRSYQVIQRLHQLRDRDSVVPPVHIQLHPLAMWVLLVRFRGFGSM